MVPAAGFLVLFLAYPLGLGIWLSFTDAKIGRAGQFIGLENYEWLRDDSIFWLSVFNTLLYTSVASVCEIRHRPLPGAAAQPAHAVQGHDPRPRAHSLHRADGALGTGILVDLRRAVLDHLMVAEAARPDQSEHQLPGRRQLGARVRDLRQHLARRAVRRHHAAGRAADGVRHRSTRPPPSTAPRAGRFSATSPIRCSPPSSPW